MFRDTNANGAEEDPASDTVEECKTSCLCNDDCVAFDFDTNDDTCWIHTDIDNIAADKRKSAAGVDHYSRGLQNGSLFPRSHSNFVKNVLNIRILFLKC